MGALIAGIAVAAVAGAAALFGSIQDDKRAREQAAKQKEYNEQMYELNKARLDEDFQAAKEQALRNASKTEQQADLTDKSLDITEEGIANDINAAIDNLYLGQQADTMSWNAQSMQAGSAEGASYAALAGNGVRAGSSLSDAVLMESATNAAQLQFSQDVKRKSDNFNLASVLNGIAGNKFNIYQNRLGADIMREDAQYLRNSYLEGGHNYNLYQNQLAQLKTTNEYNGSQLDYQYEQHAGWNSFANNMIAFHSMSAKGFQTGYNVGNTFQNASAPKFGTT